MVKTLSNPENLDYLVGWKVFECASDAEAFFRAFFYLDGVKAGATVFPCQNMPVAAKKDLRLPVNHGDLDYEVIHQNVSLRTGTERAQGRLLSSEERRLRKKQKLGECNYAML